MFLWLSEPSLLTTISVLGLIVTLADYLMPSVLASLCNGNNWSHGKEKQVDDICRTVILYKTKVECSCRSFYGMRTSRPKIVCSRLTTIAYLMFICFSITELL